MTNLDATRLTDEQRWALFDPKNWTASIKAVDDAAYTKLLDALMPLLKELALDIELGDMFKEAPKIRVDGEYGACIFCDQRDQGPHDDDCPGVKAANLVKEWEARP